MAIIEKRTASDGRASFRVRVRLRGYPHQSATFTRITDAKKWAHATEAAIREGRHFKLAEAKRHTVSDLIQRYIDEVLPAKPKSARKQTSQLHWWKSHIGAYLLADATPALLAQCRDKLMHEGTKRGPRRSPATAIRYIAVLSHAFTVAVKEWGWMEDNPLRKVTKPKEPKGRVRFLSDDERVALLSVCRTSRCRYLYCVVVLALSTGMRYSEIMWLRWPEVDLERGRAILRDTKNGDTRCVTITGHALQLVHALNKIRRIDTDLLFPNGKIGISCRPFEIRKSWEAAVQAAGISDFRFHDLRHSTASYLAMNGASLSEIAEVLGHKTLSMVKRYAHLSEAHTAGVVSALSQRLFGANGGI